MQESFFEDSFASFSLWNLASLAFINSFLAAAHNSWSILFSDKFAILPDSFNLFPRFISLSLSFLQFLDDNRMRMSLVKLIQLRLISLCPLFLHQLILQPHLLSLVPVILILLLKVLKLLQVHRLVSLLHLPLQSFQFRILHLLLLPSKLFFHGLILRFLGFIILVKLHELCLFLMPSLLTFVDTLNACFYTLPSFLLFL